MGCFSSLKSSIPRFYLSAPQKQITVLNARVSSGRQSCCHWENLKKKKKKERKKTYSWKENVDPAVLTVVSRHFPETRSPDGEFSPGGRSS